MRPASFRYVCPDSVEEALELKAEHGEEAAILAGGQSLMPMLSMRVAKPKVLIDINRLDALTGIAESADAIRLGAMTRYAQIESDPVVSARVPLLAQAMPLVAHMGVRNRGTLGGSLALADPAAESPACCIALNAEMELSSRSRGRRRVAAGSFVQGVYTTLLEPDELLEAIHLPKPKPNQRFAIREVSMRHGDFALVGLCAVATMADAALRDLRIVYFGVADRPILVSAACKILMEAGANYRDALTDAAASLQDDIQFEDSVDLSARSRRHIARTLLTRTLDDLEGMKTHA